MYAAHPLSRFSSVKSRMAGLYSGTGASSSVESASPHQLITMLFDGAMIAIGSGQACIETRNIGDKNLYVSRALRIIEEGLRASLDRKAGGALAERLDSLYDYMARRLLLASLNNDTAGFAEVGALLRDIRGAWAMIAPEAHSDAVAGR